MKLVYDIGMYDASDTRYYLSAGYKVVAVEANTSLVESAKKLFDQEVYSGQLTLVNKVISDGSKKKEDLIICGDDIGSSSIYRKKVMNRNPIGVYTVDQISIGQLIDIHGLPYYLKIDIEGADRFCVLPLTSTNKPSYISFELSEDYEELIRHLETIGFAKFKMINQRNFRELSNQRNIYDRIRRKIVNVLGYEAPQYGRFHGYFFKYVHSSGPPPWLSDGKWYSCKEILRRWEKANSKHKLGVWYDVHAM